MPEELSRIIKEFAKPLTRGDWRKGSYIVQTYRNEYNPYCVNSFRLLLLHHIEQYNN